LEEFELIEIGMDFLEAPGFMPEHASGSIWAECLLVELYTGFNLVVIDVRVL
jgi:hypothetical protein